jgi:hypothetical protein
VQTIVWLLASGMLQLPLDSVPPHQIGPVLGRDFASIAPADTQRQRPRAIEYSDSYMLRATIHRDASYATLPLFVAEYAIGRSLYNRPPDSTSSSLRTAHSVVAIGIAGLFGVNTVTGGWNLWASRKDPAGRTRRYIHSALMILSDAGFVATGALAPGHHDDPGAPIDQNRRRLHRSVAIASMSTALAGYLMMLLWKD